MILNETVEINITCRNIGYYKKYNPSIGKKLIISPIFLNPNSNDFIDVKCDFCEYNSRMKFYNYNLNTKNLTKKYYCVKCSKIKMKKTFLKNYGVENASQVKEIQDKKIKTSLERYGTAHPQQNEEIREKSKKTNLIKYGTEHTFQSELVKNKIKETCFEKYGFYHHMQDFKVFNKAQKSSCQVKTYKDSNLTYQGSYEKYFLESMEEKGLINQISQGKSYEYILHDVRHVYHSDYWFNNSIIEIKSGWTYNKNGQDLNLQLENETKWQSVRDKGDAIIVLISKKEIKQYVENLIKRL